ncbi:NUDIX hydrolase [Arcanobacterium ihumii]|uniref:NUDIX hydrolase n=1 Tax=Arcanobacterium ihumii TaxID=2138162 RepID=UPI000F528A71|nr:NUDIX domain-containing protein [Arcanobacterium ihumii]
MTENHSDRVDIYAAGAVVWRVHRGEFQVLIVHRPHWKDWSFPKGKVKPGETLRACCLRELYEEGGVHVVIGRPLGWQRYIVGGVKSKAVHFWSAQVVSDNFRPLQVRPRAKIAELTEIDERRWISYAQGLRLLSSDDDRSLLVKTHKLFKADTLDTTPLLLLRHAKAVKRERWKHGEGPEYTRALSASGKKRAEQLKVELSSYGVTRVQTSPWKRCKDTVKGYAEGIGVGIKNQLELTERGYLADPEAFSREITKVLKRMKHTRVVCLHRPTLPVVFSALEKYTSKRDINLFPKEDPWLKPGEIFVAHIAHSAVGEAKIVAVELVTSDFE